MNKVLHLLFQAQKQMPVSMGPAVSGDLLLTILFWKLVSDWWRVGGLRYWLPYGGHDPAILAMEQVNQLAVPDAAIYEACQWQNPLEAGAAIRTALYALMNGQRGRALDGVLRPERFGPLSEFAALFGNTDLLARVMNIIGGISVFSTVPQVTMGHVFSRALDILQLVPDVPPVNVVQLMAQLVNPVPGDSIYDPVCGCGQRLLAMVERVAKHHPDHQLVLYGQAIQSSQWALAKMQCLAKGLLCHRLERADALDTPMRAPGSDDLLRFDAVLLAVPFAPMEADCLPQECRARFPLGVPLDARLALIWHALASLKPSQGRLCVWIAQDLLDSDDAFSLRRYLVQRHLLEAVIQLPHKMRRADNNPPVLLLIRQQASRTPVAFMAGMLAQVGKQVHRGLYDVREIGFAYAAYQKQQAHPYLRLIDHHVMAKRHYSLAIAAYTSWLWGIASDAIHTGSEH